MVAPERAVIEPLPATASTRPNLTCGSATSARAAGEHELAGQRAIAVAELAANAELPGDDAYAAGIGHELDAVRGQLADARRCARRGCPS